MFFRKKNKEVKAGRLKKVEPVRVTESELQELKKQEKVVLEELVKARSDHQQSVASAKMFEQRGRDREWMFSAGREGDETVRYYEKRVIDAQDKHDNLLQKIENSIVVDNSRPLPEEDSEPKNDLEA